MVGQTSYEPWRFIAGVKLGPLGWRTTLTVNTRDQLSKCNDATCAATTNTGASGSEHFLNFTYHFGWVDPGASVRGTDGHYCTDARGLTVVSCSATGAVEQFIAPGFVSWWSQDPNAPHPGECYDNNERGWGLPQVCGSVNDLPGSMPTEREGSIPPAGPN
jgi:hypothetical protein